MKKRMPEIIIGIVVLVCFVLVWPIGVIRKTAVVENPLDVARSVGPITEENRICQEFIPQENYIQAISIDLNRLGGTAVAGTLHFEIQNEDGKSVFAFESPVEEITDSAFYEIQVEKWLKKGKTYTWNIWVEGLKATDVAPQLWCSNQGVLSLPENICLYYAESEDGGSAIVSYKYGAMQGKVAVLTYDSFVLFLAFFALKAIKKEFTL